MKRNKLTEKDLLFYQNSLSFSQFKFSLMKFYKKNKKDKKFLKKFLQKADFFHIELIFLVFYGELLAFAVLASLNCVKNLFAISFDLNLIHNVSCLASPSAKSIADHT